MGCHLEEETDPGLFKEFTTVKFVIVTAKAHCTHARALVYFRRANTVMRPVTCQPEGITCVHLLYTRLNVNDKFSSHVYVETRTNRE